MSKEGLRKILIEAVSVTNKDEDDLDDTIATTFNLESNSPATMRNKMSNAPTINWLQKARCGEFNSHHFGKVLKINKMGKSNAGAELYRIYDSEEDIEQQETVVLHPGL